MKRLIPVMLALLLLFAWSGSAFALSQFGQFGATDIMNVPKTNTLAEGGMGLYGSFNDGVSTFGLDLCLVADLEAGFSVTMWPYGEPEVDLRLKYHLLREKANGIGLSIGLQDLGEYLHPVSPFIVAGKTLGSGFSGFLGVGGGQINGIFLGLTKDLPTRYGSQLFLEYDSANLNFGGRFNLSPNLNLNVGIANMDTIVLGMSYVTRF